MAVRLAILLTLLTTAYAASYMSLANRASWLGPRFTITPIRIPGYPGGYPFPASFPFPVTYPLPMGFPYAPAVYESLLPSLIAQYNNVLAATANNVAAAAAAAAAAAPAISYSPPDIPPTVTPPTVAPAYRYLINVAH